MTKFDTPVKVLDEFHSFMGSGLAMDYHINGMPEKVFIEELVQRDTRQGKKPDRELYQKYIKALVLQKKLLRTSQGRVFTYTEIQRKVLEEKGLIVRQVHKTKWKVLLFLIMVVYLILYIRTHF